MKILGKVVREPRSSMKIAISFITTNCNKPATVSKLSRDFYGCRKPSFKNYYFPEGCMVVCCLRSAHFCAQDNPFSMFPGSSTLDNGSINVVLFTYETGYSLNTDCRCTFFWRETRIHYLSSSTLERNHYCSGTLIVWTEIMLDGHTLFRVFDSDCGPDVRYTEEILESYVCIFKGAGGPDFILMDDNACRHTAHLINGFLQYLPYGLTSQIVWFNNIKHSE